MNNDTLTIESINGFIEIFNTTEKVYSSGLRKIKRNSFDIIKGRLKDNSHNGKSTDEELDKYLKKRVKERKEKIIDLAFCNNWKYFITLTFDTKNKKYFPNGYSHDRAIQLLTMWLDNQRHKNKNMRYILVSEFHKESGNLHFHGLFNNVNWTFSSAINPHSGKEIVKNGCKIFNLNDYNLGFTTISEIKDSRKVSVYLSKYITKDLISLRNKKVFWYSRNLNKPKVIFRYLPNDLKDSFDNFDFYKCFSKEHCKIEIAEINNI